MAIPSMTTRPITRGKPSSRDSEAPRDDAAALAARWTFLDELALPTGRNVSGVVGRYRAATEQSVR